jgi:hypothetical protein
MESAERPHYSSLITHHLELIVIVIVVIVIFFFDDVQLNWIQSDYLKLDPTLFAIHGLAFIHVRIYVNLGFAFWARSGRHLITSSLSRSGARHFLSLQIEASI